MFIFYYLSRYNCFFLNLSAASFLGIRLVHPSLTVEILNAEQKVIPSGGIKVSFKRENKCVGVEGFTITATNSSPAIAKLNIYSFPVVIEK